MEDFEAEMRGRVAALETLFGVFIHRGAQLAPEPGRWLKETMTMVEDNLRRARAEASPTHARAAEYALESFNRLSIALISQNYVLAEDQLGGGKNRKDK